MSDRVVYHEENVYAGWPANHGAWQWGDEFLVGFMRGSYTTKERMHQIIEPFEKMHVRSMDGGETWQIEKPNVDFEALWTEPPPAFSLGGDTIIRACGIYDHGGDYCNQQGGFYLSHDRGKTWSGAYAFAGLEKLFSGEKECSARTSYHAERGLVFISNRWADHFGTDSSFVAVHDGEKFNLVSAICDDEYRAAMPVVAEINGRLVAAIRRTNFIQYWIEAFGSDDGGASWRPLKYIAIQSVNNGNPPALIAASDRLVCAWGDRDAGSICISESFDKGETWSGPKSIRDGGKPDIGYPQLFLRSDGQVVCVYYWADKVRPHQHIAATIFH